MLKKYLKNQKGFTMIEMMVVLIIIAVLIGGGIKFYLGYVEKAKITKAKGEISIMQAALDSYYAESEKGEYPAESDEELAKAGLATDRISMSTDKTYKYEYLSGLGKEGYKITTTNEFNRYFIIATGEKGKSFEPELTKTKTN